MQVSQVVEIKYMHELNNCARRYFNDVFNTKLPFYLQWNADIKLIFINENELF